MAATPSRLITSSTAAGMTNRGQGSDCVCGGGGARGSVVGARALGGAGAHGCARAQTHAALHARPPPLSLPPPLPPRPSPSLPPLNPPLPPTCRCHSSASNSSSLTCPMRSYTSAFSRCASLASLRGGAGGGGACDLPSHAPEPPPAVPLPPTRTAPAHPALALPTHPPTHRPHPPTHHPRPPPSPTHHPHPPTALTHHPHPPPLPTHRPPPPTALTAAVPALPPCSPAPARSPASGASASRGSAFAPPSPAAAWA